MNKVYYWDDDDVIKQKIASELDKYTMSQKQVSEYLNVRPSFVNGLIDDKRLIPIYTYNKNNSRKVNIFFKKDVEEYGKILKVYRNNRKGIDK